MILAYPALLIGTFVLMRTWTPRVAGSGWRGFALWTLAGALFTFSLLTGLSIGLLLLPLVVVALGIAVRSAPNVRASLGFVAGSGAIVLALFALP
ncbi:MAG: hypothetical protein ACJ768_00475 [Gaiellaceae bacterium]